ncbi:MAG: hypothetical protein HY707_04310 [Ignavibacteriae bacterium]|nr:hypothetical protein [Ignavibacteriota bacterium]
MISKTIGFILSVVLIVWVSWTCKDDLVDPGPVDIVFPDSGVSYGTHVQPLFDRACAFIGCHAGETPQRDLSLESYQKATERVGIIVPYDPDGSILVQAIEGIAPNTRRMPLFRSPLTDNQIKGIRTWIKEGALPN